MEDIFVFLGFLGHFSTLEFPWKRLIYLVYCPVVPGIKVIMQGKLFQRCMHLLYCSVLSMVGKHKMSKPGMGSIFLVIASYNYVNYQNYQNVMLLTSLVTKRTLMHLFLFINSPQRELVSIYTQSVRNYN